MLVARQGSCVEDDVGDLGADVRCDRGWVEEVTGHDGVVKSGAEVDYNGSPAGYADHPEEVINYVDAHDNETLFDLGVLKLPQETSMADRIRMNTLSLATATFSQSPSFWHAGTERWIISGNTSTTCSSKQKSPNRAIGAAKI